MVENTSNQSRYKIGAVSRITGIGIETLRMWERRYGAVEPARGKGTGRLYSEADISRLTLLKQLVDKGNSISTVANLDQQALIQRLESMQQLAGSRKESALGTNHRLRGLVCGRSLPLNLRINQDQLRHIELVAACDSLQDIDSSLPVGDLDLLLVEYPVVHQEDIRKIREAASLCGCENVLVVYAYCNKKVLNNLAIEGIHVLPAPVMPALIDRRCRELFMTVTETRTDDLANTVKEAEPLVRRYDDATLARITASATSINCECPHHLADIIYKLAAFEEYSASCENRNTEDRQLHAMLFRVTNRARAMFEDTLAQVIDYEGIDIS